MIWVYTCEFHRRFPLDESLYCDCHIEHRIADDLFTEPPLMSYMRDENK
jgi:hypothetical protein